MTWDQLRQDFLFRFISYEEACVRLEDPALAYWGSFVSENLRILMRRDLAEIEKGHQGHAEQVVPLFETVTLPTY